VEGRRRGDGSPSARDRRGFPGSRALTTTSYYGRPVLKEPVWKPQIPFYLFTGGLGGAGSVLSLGARAAGHHELARRTLLVSAAADAVSPVLLATDLGRPERFLNMLRLFKITSPMSIGSWILAASGTASGAAAGCEFLGILPRIKVAAEAISAALGAPLATYTAVLLSDTAIPVWHEARRELPLVFASSSAATAGAAGVLVGPPEESGPARRLLLGGVALTAAATKLMEKRLGTAAEPYKQGAAGALMRAGKGLSAAGAALVGLGGGRRKVPVAGAALVLAGEVCLRWSVFRAGFQSARDPKYTVEPQRRRLEEARP
jgi:formate-dependent nitrite reductase membrane component NrfD